MDWAGRCRIRCAFKRIGGGRPRVWLQPKSVHFLREDVPDQCSQREHSLLRGDYPIWPGLAEIEFSRHLPHARLKDEYGLT